jgi:FAD/FMN-containing dehydrogenase
MSGFLRPEEISDLRSAFGGKVIAPGDDDYDAARTIFPGGFDRHPALIVRVAGAPDVARVFDLAREKDLGVSVRGGGHTPLCVADGAIMIDLRSLTGIDIDVPQRTVWAGGGLTAAEVTAAVAEHGLAIGFGDTGSVGIGGVTLAGGVGFLVRKFGMTIDNLLAAEVVTPSGSTVVACAAENADLFWAIRGGGGNFGVVTRFQYALHELPEMVGGLLMLPATVRTITGLVSLALAAPDELSAIANVMAAPPLPFIPEEYRGELIVMALLAYAGPAWEGEKVLAPFRELATPLADMLRPMRYPEMFMPEDESYHPTAVGDTMFVESVGPAEAETILHFLRDSDAPMRAAQVRVLGGAMGRVAPDATAFAHRYSPIMLNLASFYVGPQDLPVRQEWLKRFAAAMRQNDGGAYAGFLSEEDSAQVRRAYPETTWARLAELKRRYDPENLLHRNQNIVPA